MQKPPYPMIDEALALPEVQGKTGPDREATARALLGAMRREQLPDRRTWTMSDPAPLKEWLLGVVDGDGGLWRAKPGVDSWVLEEAPSVEDTGATFTWFEMLSEFGPVTEPPEDWRPQRTEVLEAFRGTVVELDDLLFHELGAHRAGTEIPDGWTTEHSPDGEIVSRAKNWAQRLRQQAQALEDALAKATLLEKDSEG